MEFFYLKIMKTEFGGGWGRGLISTVIMRISGTV